MATGRYTAVANLFTPSESAAAPTHYGYFTEETGGIFLARDAITGSPEAFTINAVVRFPANTLLYTLLPGAGTGRLTPAGAKYTLDKILEDVIWLALFSAEPNDNGSNELAIGGYGRTALTVASWTTAV